MKTSAKKRAPRMHVLYLIPRHQAIGIFWSAAAALRYGDQHYPGMQMVAAPIHVKVSPLF